MRNSYYDIKSKNIYRITKSSKKYLVTDILLIDQFLDVARQIYYLARRFLCPKRASLVRALNKNS